MTPLSSATDWLLGGDPTTGGGTVHVFQRSGGNWSQEQRLRKQDPNVGETFGTDVALSDSGSVALVGAPGVKGKGGAGGAIYVFERSNGQWQETFAHQNDDGDSLGQTVALSGAGDTAVAGAGEDEDQSGSARVFERTNGGWSDTTQIAASDGKRSDRFGGAALDMSRPGDRILVGVPRQGDPNGNFSGSAYLYARSNGTWSQETKLEADDGDKFDNFGASVALSGEKALVGADADDDPNGDEAGAAYVFELASGTWSQRTKLSADDGNHGDWFGSAAAMESGTAALAAQQDDAEDQAGAGSVYVFE